MIITTALYSQEASAKSLADTLAKDISDSGTFDIWFAV